MSFDYTDMCKGIGTRSDQKHSLRKFPFKFRNSKVETFCLKTLCTKETFSAQSSQVSVAKPPKKFQVTMEKCVIGLNMHTLGPSTDITLLPV